MTIASPHGPRSQCVASVCCLSCPSDWPPIISLGWLSGFLLGFFEITSQGLEDLTPMFQGSPQGPVCLINISKTATQKALLLPLQFKGLEVICSQWLLRGFSKHLYPKVWDIEYALLLVLFLSSSYFHSFNHSFIGPQQNICSSVAIKQSEPCGPLQATQSPEHTEARTPWSIYTKNWSLCKQFPVLSPQAVFAGHLLGLCLTLFFMNSLLIDLYRHWPYRKNQELK